MYDIYRYVFIGGLILSLVFLAVTVFVFFFLNIRGAIGDLTGSNKRKAMEKAKSGKPQKPQKPVSKQPRAGGESPQLTSKLSIQERYDAMEDSQHTTTLNLEKKNRAKKPPKTQKIVPDAAQPSAQPGIRQTQNYAVPTVINTPGFVVESEITFIHSGEAIL